MRTKCSILVHLAFPQNLRTGTIGDHVEWMNAGDARVCCACSCSVPNRCPRNTMTRLTTGTEKQRMFVPSKNRTREHPLSPSQLALSYQNSKPGGPVLPHKKTIIVTTNVSFLSRDDTFNSTLLREGTQIQFLRLYSMSTSSLVTPPYKPTTDHPCMWELPSRWHTALCPKLLQKGSDQIPCIDFFISIKFAARQQ